MARRQKKPTPTFETVFVGALQELAAEFLKSSGFQHAGTKGTEREVPVQEFFRSHLPATYSVAKGEVVDLRDSKSPQLDLMIYDRLRNHAFYSGDSQILPAEALLASIEVKTRLDRGEMAKSVRAAKNLRSLRPFKLRLSDVRERGERADEHARYFHCIFAYETDLAEDNWLSKEFLRVGDVAAEEGVDEGVVDRIYVANRGLIHPAARRGVLEPKGTGRALMHFYMHVWNFVSRENARRKPAPYLHYAGRLTKGWTKLRKPNEVM